MNNKLTILIATVLISLSASAKSLPAYLPQNGLVAYFPFNGNALDESGNGNSGTLIKASLTTDRKGNANQAYNFDGFANQYIMGTNFNLPIGKSARTITMWMNLKGIVNTGWTLTAFGYGQQNTGNSQMLGLWDGKIRYASWADDLDILYSYNLNQWIHVTATFDGTFAKLFANGVPIGTGNKSTWNTMNSSNFFIGTRPDSISSFFNGKLDDIGIWNRVLTNAEILQIYNETVPSNLPYYLPKTGLLAWFPFNGNANDESGNGNNPVSNTATLSTDKMGNPNKAYLFDGNLGQYIKCTNANMPSGKSQRTISMWLNCAGIVNSGWTLTAFSYGDQFTSKSQMIGFWDGKLRYASWADDFDYLYSYNYNTWYHITVTFNGVEAAIYANGSPMGTMTKSAWNTFNSSYLYIGTRPDAISSHFNGKIDDIGVWNRVLTNTEIQALYNGVNALGELKKEVKFAMYPNPTNSKLNFEIDASLQSSIFQVYDLNGSIIQESVLDKNNQISVDDLKSGIYFIRIKDRPDLALKFIKE